MPLSPEQVLTGYRIGIFPMAESRRGRVFWLAPDPRAILPLEGFHASRRLRDTIRAKKFRVATDTAFERVIDGCADRPETWISAEVREAYVELHRRGHAHSVEAWSGSELAGGLYGVLVGGAFMAESKFHRGRDASKVALAGLVSHLRRIGARLCDVQFLTPHLLRLGAVEVRRDEYLRRLGKALDASPAWGPAGPVDVAI